MKLNIKKLLSKTNLYGANYYTIVEMNFNLHNLDSTLLIGNISDCDVVKEVTGSSYIDAHQNCIEEFEHFLEVLL